MKLRLVIPRFSPPGFSYAFPLGLAYISSAVKAAGHEVTCLNLNNEEIVDRDAIEAAVKGFDPDVCGTGSISPLFGAVKEIMSVARETKPSIVNVIGGGVFSSAPEVVTPLLDIDMGVVGEGEETIVEILHALEHGGDLKDIKGIGVKGKDGECQRTEARPPIRDISKLPWPDYEGLDLERFLEIQNIADEAYSNIIDTPRSLPMISSRSCPYACTFCFHPTSRIYRERPMDAFFEELDWLIDKYDVNLLEICDELFTAKKQRALDFCERIKPYDLKWQVQLHVSMIDAELLETMEDAGCILASYGLESANDDVLLSMKKKATRAQIENALGLTHEKKVGIQGNFIFGDTAETMRTINDTMDWWSKHREYRVNLSFLQVYPGTPIYHHAVETGIIKETAKDGDLVQGIINTTILDNETYERMMRRLRIYRETLVIPAPVVQFEQQNGELVSGKPLYHIVWDCPRCGTRNDFRNVRTDMPHHQRALIFACRDCKTRFDVPNPTVPPVDDPELDELYNEAIARRQAGDVRGAAEKYLEIVNKTFPPFAPPPESYVRACFDLGNIFLREFNDVEHAIVYLGEAVMHRAFDPRCHFAFALALMNEGSIDGAQLHCETARRLISAENPDEMASVDQLAAAIASQKAADETPTFFIG